MKFKIYKEEKEVLFALRENKEGGITLHTIHKDGRAHYGILSINKDGYLVLHQCISEDFGLKIDSGGRMLVLE